MKNDYLYKLYCINKFLGAGETVISYDIVTLKCDDTILVIKQTISDVEVVFINGRYRDMLDTRSEKVIEYPMDKFMDSSNNELVYDLYNAFSKHEEE